MLLIVFVCQLSNGVDSNKKICLLGCFPGIWRECYPGICFGLPSKFYHLFYKKPSPSIPTSRESPVIVFFAPVQHGFGTLRAYHHRKKLQQADELIKAGRLVKHGKTIGPQKRTICTYIYIPQDPCREIYNRPMDPMGI